MKINGITSFRFVQSSFYNDSIGRSNWNVPVADLQQATTLRQVYHLFELSSLKYLLQNQKTDTPLYCKTLWRVKMYYYYYYYYYYYKSLWTDHSFQEVRHIQCYRNTFSSDVF